MIRFWTFSCSDETRTQHISCGSLVVFLMLLQLRFAVANGALVIGPSPSVERNVAANEQRRFGHRSTAAPTIKCSPIVALLLLSCRTCWRHIGYLALLLLSCRTCWRHTRNMCLLLLSRRSCWRHTGYLALLLSSWRICWQHTGYLALLLLSWRTC